MRKNLLEFLFGTPVVDTESTERLGERIVQMFEDADELEKVDMAVNKKPLEDALKNLGIGAKVETAADCCTLVFDSGEDYRTAFLKIFTPEGLHDLAEAGWVPAQHGDEAQSNEPPCFKIGFIEIDVAGEDAEDKKKGPALKGIMKAGRENATTELDRDDDLNPVENPDGEIGKRQTGVGKTASGEAPEGTPKGSKKNESLEEGKHKPGCQCGFCKNKGKFGKKADTKDDAIATEALTARQLADRLLEATTTGAVPAISEPPLAAMRPPQETRLDRLKKRRADLAKKGFFAGEK